MPVSRASQIERLLSSLNQLDESFSLPLLRTLLAIEASDGISVNALAEAVSVPQQTASRYVSILQGRYQPLGSGENFFAKDPLIEIGISQEDPRKRSVKLTAKGRSAVDSLLKPLFKGVQ